MVWRDQTSIFSSSVMLRVSKLVRRRRDQMEVFYFSRTLELYKDIITSIMRPDGRFDITFVCVSIICALQKCPPQSCICGPWIVELTCWGLVDCPSSLSIWAIIPARILPCTCSFGSRSAAKSQVGLAPSDSKPGIQNCERKRSAYWKGYKKWSFSLVSIVLLHSPYSFSLSTWNSAKQLSFHWLSTSSAWVQETASMVSQCIQVTLRVVYPILQVEYQPLER